MSAPIIYYFPAFPRHTPATPPPISYTNPNTISGLISELKVEGQCYKEFSSQTTLAANGDLVGSAIDLVHSTRWKANVAVGGNTQTQWMPTYTTNVFNGKPSLRFSGTNKFQLGSITLAQPFTTVFLWKTTGTPTTGNIAFDGYIADRAYIQPYPVGNLRLYAGANGVCQTAVTFGINFITIACYNGSSTYFKFNSNPVLMASADAGNASPNGITIGNQGSQGAGYPVAMDFGYGYIFNKSLDAGEQQICYDWLYHNFLGL